MKNCNKAPSSGSILPAFFAKSNLTTTHTSHLQGVLARNQVGKGILLFLLPFAYLQVYQLGNFLPWIGKRRCRVTAPCVLDLCHGGQCWSSLDKSSENLNGKLETTNQYIWISNWHSQLQLKLTLTWICFAAKTLLETLSIITCTKSVSVHKQICTNGIAWERPFVQSLGRWNAGHFKLKSVQNDWRYRDLGVSLCFNYYNTVVVPSHPSEACRFI